MGFPKRHAISRARFFLELAEKCDASQRDAFESYLEAAIVFGRTAIHRLQSQYKSHPKWKQWFGALSGDETVNFFREQRDFILKEGPPKIGQIVTLNPVNRAAQLYYFDSPDIAATETVRHHLDLLVEIVNGAEATFS